ncbi:hypothetical protein [Thermofilum pendens]|uniref:Class I SAM-dependent methyltransferase n=1 Tax=Thermofilum pendens (strain DSM 2475 / Hrk 5) TaxID=368408 RepID=A1RWA8_THEPD|nr:hypothetical protein [Thermofilum pendens]ABL77488.1 hypothetical protein Tpen_0078 [Thermofilum pendens Hrk 5]
MSYPEVYHDISILLLPEALSELKKASAPQLEEISPVEKYLPQLLTAATERLKSRGLGVEEKEFQEVFRYGITSIARAYAEGDWRFYAFFSELFTKISIIDSLYEWSINIASLPPRATFFEVNTVAPVYLSRLSQRVSGSPGIITEKRFLYNSTFKEIYDEYSRRYDLKLNVVPLEDADRLASLNGTVDVLVFATLDAMSLGWRTILGMASSLLKKGGTLIAIVPDNKREGLRSLLRAWRIPDYEPPETLATNLQDSRFTKIRYSTKGPFSAFVAQKR